MSYGDVELIILGLRFSTQGLLEQGGVSVALSRAARKVFGGDPAISDKFKLGILRCSGHKREETPPRRKRLHK